jgi:hypothetical protein
MSDEKTYELTGGPDEAGNDMYRMNPKPLSDRMRERVSRIYPQIDLNEPKSISDEF